MGFEPETCDRTIQFKIVQFEQKLLRVEVVQELLNEVDNYPVLFKRVITGDKTWLHGNDVKTKAKSPKWRHSESPRTKENWKSPRASFSIPKTEEYLILSSFCEHR